MAKKFISFLGTGNYQKCVYQFNEIPGQEVVYIQDDLIDRFCADFTEEDKIVVFLTKEAKEKHWKNNLKEIIEGKKLRCKPCPVDINDSKTESDIWGLFEQIYSHIEDGDEVIFDLTHSFRYLPMLFFSILHYASFIKKISVKGIYYGAWEAREENIAPIFDLTNTFKIMEWANAADAFTNYGVADKLVKCVNQTAKDYKGSSGLVKNILSITKDISYSRTIQIAQGEKFQKVRESISELESEIQPLFKPILEKVSEKIEKFEENSTLNFIPAVKWCIDHEMTPQGFTMLQEGLLSYIIDKHQCNYQDRDLRVVVSGRLNQREGQEYKPHPKEINYPTELDKILNDAFTKECCGVYQSISQSRNDVNHGGTGERSSGSTEKLFNRLKEYFDEVKALCKKHSVC